MADAGVCRLLGRALHADDAINETLELITLPSRRHMSARRFVCALENDILFFCQTLVELLPRMSLKKKETIQQTRKRKGKFCFTSNEKMFDK